MNELDQLRAIRPVLLNRTVQSMARGAGTREDLRSQLEVFFNLLEQSVETGDSGWLLSVLKDWSTSLTQTDLREPSSYLTAFISELMKHTFEVARETLDESQALALITALSGPFAFCFEKAAEVEINARVSYVTHELNQTRQTLEKLDKRKSDFISVAAHELKTPLTLVEGYSAMLREMVEKNENGGTDLMLIDGISNGARRLHAIIDDMIDVSLLDNRLFSLNIQPLWINRLINILKNELEFTLQERELTLSIHEFPGFGEMTFGDPERLLQVFRNVLFNAVKFTPNGGTIWIDGRLLPGFIEVTIRDNGIGIDTEEQAIIFDKFTRLGNVALHSSGKTKFKGGGPGLGLHIAKGIIEAHGGAIWVESEGYDEENCPGSTFHILIPLYKEAPDSKSAKLFASLLNPNSNPTL